MEGSVEVDVNELKKWAKIKIQSKGIMVKMVFYRCLYENFDEESNDDTGSPSDMRLRVKLTIKQGSKFEWFKQIDLMMKLGLDEVLISPESHQQ